LTNYPLVSSIVVKGDIQFVFDIVRKSMIDFGYKEESSESPKQASFTRGSGGILKTKIKNCKTFLIISFKEHSTLSQVDILFDYTFDIPGLLTARDKEFIQGEMLKIHHNLFDVPSSSTPKFFKPFNKKSDFTK